MANPYALDQIEPQAANDASNPYGLGAIQADSRTVLRSNLMGAQQANPDQTAEAVKLARTTGSPYEAIRANLPEVQQGQKLDAYEKMLAGATATRKFMEVPQNADMGIDDVSTLTSIEKGLREFFKGGGGRVDKPVSAVMRSNEYSAAVREAMRLNPMLDADAARELVMRGTTVDNQSALAGPVRGQVPGVGSVLSGLGSAASRIPQVFDAGLGYIAADILGLSPNPYADKLANLETQNVSQSPEFETATAKGLYAGGISTIQNLPGIALSIATGSPVPGLTMAGIQSSVPAYSKYRERGAGGGMAALGAVGEGAVEVATEFLPMSSMLKVFGKSGQGAALQFMKSQFQEQWTEQIATIAQDAIDTAVANPNKTWGEYLAERPDAAYQTFLATLVQTGAMTVANQAAKKLSGKEYAQNEQVQKAEQAAVTAENLTTLAEASKLRARDPESFAQFINQVAEDGEAPVDLFISAETLTNTLNQAGITIERLEMIAPVVAAQMRAASFVPGADIRMPMAEFLAAGADITTPLIDHLRASEDAMSRAETKQFRETEGERIQGEVEAELRKITDRQAWQKGVDTLASQFEAEMNIGGQFGAGVKKAYSGLLGNFYATQAARAGMLPEEFRDRYKLGVTDKTGRGAQTLEQQNNSVDAATGLALPDKTFKYRSPEWLKYNALFNEAVRQLKASQKMQGVGNVGKRYAAMAKDAADAAREFLDDNQAATQSNQEQAAPENVAKREELIALRKRESVLKSLMACLEAA